MPVESLSFVTKKSASTGTSKAPDQTRADYVYEQLREAIQGGRVRCRERIREEDVAKSLGVSRTPVREALRRLQQRGLLQMAGGRGLVVAELDRPQALELYAIREVLEGSAARFAAQHATEVEIDNLRRLHDAFVAAEGDSRQMAIINRKFHDAIYEAAHNRYLNQLLTELHDAMALLQDTLFARKSRPQAVDVEHRRIIAAIAARDPEAAEEAGREHIRHALQSRMEVMLAEVC